MFVVALGLALAGPARAETGAEWQVPVPGAARKVAETGSETVFHDARSAKVVVAFYRKAFEGLQGAACLAPRGDDPPLLRCTRSLPLGEGSVEIVTVELRKGKGATVIRVAHRFDVVGTVDLPTEFVLPRAPVRYVPLDTLSH